MIKITESKLTERNTADRKITECSCSNRNFAEPNVTEPEKCGKHRFRKLNYGNRIIRNVKARIVILRTVKSRNVTSRTVILRNVK